MNICQCHVDTKCAAAFVKTVKRVTNLIRTDSFNYSSLNLNYSCQLNGAVNSPDVTLLTLRRLMSYIYIYMEHPFLMFLDHTQRRSTVGRTPLDE